MTEIHIFSGIHKNVLNEKVTFLKKGDLKDLQINIKALKTFENFYYIA